MPPDNAEPMVLQFVAKAETDLGAAAVLAQTEGDYGDVVCFHCQQAVEKMLKAAMLAADIDPPRTHDLVYLLETLGAVRRIPAGLDEICTQLADLGVAPRYPGWSVDSLHLDPHQVLESARLALALLRPLVAAEKTEEHASEKPGLDQT